MSNTYEHKIITAFDIYKDAKLFNKLPVKIENNSNLSDNIKYITSITDNIENIKKKYENIKTNNFFTNLQKNEVIKTPIKSLGTIYEKELTTVNKCKKAIKKEKPRFLTGPMNFFHDAGSYPTEFCEQSENCKYYETIASYIDPGPRPSNNTFIDTRDVSIEINPLDILHQCGIGDTGTKIKYETTENKESYKITITFKPFNLNDIETITLEGIINRNGKFIGIINVKVKNNVTELTLNNIDDLKDLFQGNNTKNKYINKHNTNTKDKNTSIISTLYYLCKELGDTYQAIILKMIIDHLKKQKSLNGFNVNNGKTDGEKQNITDLNETNCCLSTNDSVLFLRSKSSVINIPVLLYNNGYVRYYSSLSKTKIIKKILTDDIDSAIKENKNTINFLRKIDQNTEFKIGAKTDPSIRLNLTKESGELFGYPDKKFKCQELLEMIKVNIETVNGFLEGLKDFINQAHPIMAAAAKPFLKDLKDPSISISISSNLTLKNIQEKNIENRRITYGAICNNLTTLLAEDNKDTTYMQSIQRNINAFKSLLTIETSDNDYKIIYKTKSIFPNISLLQPDNKLRDIMKQCSFIRGGKFIEFKDWLNGNRNDSRGGHSHRGGVVGYNKNDIYDFTYDEDIEETNNFIFLYENLFPYINCFPQLLYCFNKWETLEEFINNLLNFINSNLKLTNDKVEQDISILVNEIIKSEKDNYQPDNPKMSIVEGIPVSEDIIIDNFLKNVGSMSLAMTETAASVARAARMFKTNELKRKRYDEQRETDRPGSPLSYKKIQKRTGEGLTKKRRKRNKKIQTFKKNLNKKIQTLKKNLKKKIKTLKKKLTIKIKKNKLNPRKYNKTPKNKKNKFFNTIKRKKNKKDKK